MKLDEIFAMTYLSMCRLEREKEVPRQRGKPQPERRKCVQGSLLLLMFTACIWGPSPPPLEFLE